MLESGKRERAGPIARGCTFDLRVNRETLVGARLQCNRNPLNRLPSYGIDYTPGNWWNHLSSNNEKFGKYRRAQEEPQNNLTADSVMDFQCGNSKAVRSLECSIASIELNITASSSIRIGHD